MCLECFIWGVTGLISPCVVPVRSRDKLKDVVALLRNSGDPQVEYIIRTLKKWAKDNRVLLS